MQRIQLFLHMRGRWQFRKITFFRRNFLLGRILSTCLFTSLKDFVINHSLLSKKVKKSKSNIRAYQNLFKSVFYESGYTRSVLGFIDDCIVMTMINMLLIFLLKSVLKNMTLPTRFSLYSTEN